MIPNAMVYKLCPCHEESPQDGVVVRYLRGEMELSEWRTDWSIVEACVGFVGGRYQPDPDWLVESIEVHESDQIDWEPVRKMVSFVVRTRYQPQPLMIS